MVEAFAIVGFASALMTFLDFGTRVLRRMRQLEHQAEESTSYFKGVRNRLPLMLDLVKKIMLQMEAGLVSDKSKETMYPVVQNCISQAQQLDRMFNKMLPQPSDTTWARGKKAVFSVMSESEVERIDTGLKSNFELLVQAGTFQVTSRQDNSNPTTIAPTFALSPTFKVTLPQHNSHSVPLPWEEKEKEASDAKAIFAVPFPRDPNFLGRQDVINAVSKAFQTSHVVALSGLGGIGKSQIAIDYCYAFKEAHPEAHVFWVYGAVSHLFEQGYQDIAKKARIPGCDDQKMDKLQLVYEWLQSTDSKEWLMAVDNADDAAMFYGPKRSELCASHDSSKLFARFLPRCPHGRVLITTRDRRLGDRLSHRGGTIQVTTLGVEESKDLLKSKISEANRSEDDVLKLVEYLSYLPLAITQAAAFISENSMTVSEYLETLLHNESEEKELLSEHLEDPRRELSSENSVVRTWRLSFAQISNESPCAAEILSLLAVLDYNGTPWSLLRNEGETETGFRTALGILQAFSLITVTKGHNAICKIHRLVALATERWLETRRTISYWQSRALTILTKRFPGPGQQSYLEFANMLALMPHAQLVLSYQFKSTDEMLLCARLLISTALFDLSSARYTQAFEKCERSLVIREDLLPSDHPETVESLQTLGEALLHRGELRVAKATLQRAIVGREKSLGHLHVDTLESLSDLTITLLELNDLDSAEKTGQEALEGRREVFGQNHPDYLVSLNIIAILYQLKGDFKRALEVTERVLRDREKLLGGECPETLMTLNNLARLKYQIGDLDTADQMLDRVLAGEEAALAKNGYDMQVSLRNKAQVLVARKWFHEAEDVFRNVLAMQEKAVGPLHPSTLSTMKDLVNVLEKQNDPKAAEELRNKIANFEKDGLKPGEVGALFRAGLLFD